MRVRLATLTVALALGFLATPVATDAQPAGKVYRIGLFHVGLDHVPPSLEPLRQGLKELGYEEGKNLHWDWRNLGDEEAAHAIAREFARSRVDLIVAFENQTVRAARAVTTEIPIVFLHVTDPVAEGFVKTLAHPDGNLTGLVGFRDLTGKELQLFKELVPGLRRVLVLIDPGDPATGRLLSDARRSATTLGLRLLEREASTQAHLERLFGAVTPGTVDGVFIVSPNLQTRFTSLVIRLATQRALPVPAHRKAFVEQGALFSYAPDYSAVGRLAAARYVDRILKGAKPADLPVEQMSELGLVVNLKAARALGLAIAPSMMLRANEVIE